MSAGIYARKNGHRVLLFERQKVAGGNLTGWRRGEYTIDNCIHWLTGTNPNTKQHRIWQDLGALGSVEIYQPETLYTCETDGQRLSLHKDLERLERDMLAISPKDKQEILALTKAIRTLQNLFGIGGEKHDQRASLSETIFSAPSLLRYYGMSTSELSKKFTHPLLQKFIVCMLGGEFTALALLVTFATFCGENGGLPKGGSPAMAQRMAKRFYDLGGELYLGKEATKICLEGNRAASVSFADGTSETADYVVCAVDTKITFDRLLGKRMPHALSAQYADPKMQRFSAYHSAFACDVADLNFRGDLIFALPWQYKKLLKTPYLILREFSHEPSFAPAGKTVLQTLTFCNEATAGEFIELRKDKAAYKKRKQELARILETAICEKLPALRGTLKCLDVWTPATYHRYTGSETGSFMSFLLPKNRLPMRLSSTVAGVKNVLLATQWQQAPGGLPTAAELGKRAAEQIEKKERARARFPVLFPSPKRKAKPVS